ncbi:GNAT family N-acetyltransferase [Chryseobacterium sp. POL2]|uniref:GNAT family N-acetyltransferase n=1 Tax=Chryseobacterium sp. POL2 TaxID=2713414 RepID=UPI0013E11A4E|nr:GNAT family N-acetyltransferase [Chryseobacterium sp. POL2]QIG88720.1 GNAT family N-acetyltransferase [Chryseobacterium sp. POL2]
MSLKIDVAKINEIDALMPMMKDFYAIDNYPFDTELTRKNFEIFINNSNLGQCFLLKDDSGIVGYMILNFLFSFEFGGMMCFLDELYVKPEAQGKKYGGKAVEFAQNFAKEKDLKMMFLEIENHNERAMHLYKKLGFEMHKRSIMTYET